MPLAYQIYSAVKTPQTHYGRIKPAILYTLAGAKSKRFLAEEKRLWRLYSPGLPTTPSTNQSCVNSS
jgi:hypothetical protein